MRRDVDLIIVPYDSGMRDVRMGRGPSALVRAGVTARLAREGVDVRVVPVEPETNFTAEIATAFELQRGVRRAVEASIAAGRLPMSLTGNCNTGVVGSLAAAPLEDTTGLFWFDAHSDAETPETTTSGFLDGTGLAMALGCCWSGMLNSVGSWTLEGSHTALVGAREISAAAQRLLYQRDVAIVAPPDARAGSLQPVFERFAATGVRRVHVHIDLDVLDSEMVGPANTYALPDGLTEQQLLDLVEQIMARYEVASASVASYDPDVDETGRVAAAGVNVVTHLAASGQTVG
jgi:arginase